MGATLARENRNELQRMYAVANDYEAASLDSLRERAGCTWECRDESGRSHWTNDETDKHCGQCGTPKPHRATAGAK